MKCVTIYILALTSVTNDFSHYPSVPRQTTLVEEKQKLRMIDHSES